MILRGYTWSLAQLRQFIGCILTVQVKELSTKFLHCIHRSILHRIYLNNKQSFFFYLRQYHMYSYIDMSINLGKCSLVCEGKEGF